MDLGTSEAVPGPLETRGHGSAWKVFYGLSIAMAEIQMIPTQLTLHALLQRGDWSILRGCDLLEGDPMTIHQEEADSMRWPGSDLSHQRTSKWYKTSMSSIRSEMAYETRLRPP